MCFKICISSLDIRLVDMNISISLICQKGWVVLWFGDICQKVHDLSNNSFRLKCCWEYNYTHIMFNVHADYCKCLSVLDEKDSSKLCIVYPWVVIYPTVSNHVSIHSLVFLHIPLLS